MRGIEELCGELRCVRVIGSVVGVLGDDFVGLGWEEVGVDLEAEFDGDSKVVWWR